MLHPEDGILHAYLDGECTPGEQADIEEHLAVCAECSARMEEAKGLGVETVSLLAELEPAAIQMPPWQELERRATARRATALRATALQEEELGETVSPAPVSPFWRMPALAWAASLVVAFGLGYLVSTEWPGVVTAPEQVTVGDLQALEDQPSTPTEELDVAGEPQVRTEGEVRADSPRPSPTDDRPGQDRDAGEMEVSDAMAQAAAGEAKAVDRIAGLEEAVPAPTPPSASQEPGGPPVDPDAAVAANTEAGRRDPSVPAELGGAQAFAARKKPEVAEREQSTQQVLPAVSAAPDARQRAVMADPEAEVALEEARAAGTGGYGAFLDSFAVPPSADESRHVSAVGFISVSPESAAAWLGAPLRSLPDLTLIRVEVGPGSVVDGAMTDRPLVALFYEDAAGQSVTLLQQYSASETAARGSLRRSASGPATIVTPSGLRAYRWEEADYRLTLIGSLSSDSLRALADRVR